MKKLSALIACLLAASTLLTACGGNDGGDGTGSAGSHSGDHTHTFEEHWSTDETSHWHAANCEHVDEIADKADHVDEDGNDVCDVCGFRKNHVHTYEEAWTMGEKTHYHKNTCGHDDVEKYRADEAAHTDENNDGSCDVCAYDGGHVHTYAEEWSQAEGGHWHAPTCGHDVPGNGLVDHVDADNNGICDDCAYDYDHTHTYAEAWTTDDDSHWHEVSCGHSIPVADKGAHVDANHDGQCDTCALEIAHYHTFEEGWTSDATGHWHKGVCHPDAKDAEAAHNGYDQDGKCDTCGYIVFHLYHVSIVLDDDSVKVTAPDGSHSATFAVKEGTEAVFKLTMPERLFIATITGADLVGKPVKENGQMTYTLRIAAVNEDTQIAPFIDKNGNAEVIVGNGQFEITAQKFIDNVGTLTVHVPSSGHYIIYSTSHPGLLGPTFSVEDNDVVQDDTSIAYAFNADGEGDVDIDYTYFAWSSGKITFSYVVVKFDPKKTLTSMTGSNYPMPTNVNVNLTFTVPAPGTYQISSSYPVAWDGDVTSPHTFTVAPGELTRTISVSYHLEGAPTFDFDWEIKPMGGNDLTVDIGETPVTAPLSDYVGLTFTAPHAGLYYFELSEPGMFFYSQSANGSMNAIGSEWRSEQMATGETITLYLRVNIFDENIEAEISGTLSIGFIPPAGEDGYNALVGTQNIFVSSDHREYEYMIVLSAGSEISLDNGETWQTGVDNLVIPAYGTLTYLVRNSNGADTVSVSFEKIAYEHTLTIGENTVTMIPGKEYEFTLTGTASPDFYASYLLYWTDDLTVNYRGQTLSSGAEIDQYSANSSTLTITYNGSAETQIQLTLEDNYTAPTIDPSMLDGTYNVDYEGENVYVLTFTPNADGTTGKLTVTDNNENITGDVSGEYLYTFSVSSGLTVTTLSGETTGILISVNSVGYMTFQCDGLRLPLIMFPASGDGGDGDDEGGGAIPSGHKLTLGANSVDVSVSGAPVYFTATEAGTYTFNWASGENNGDAMIETASGSESISIPHSVTLAAGETFSFVLGTLDWMADTIDLTIQKTA